jgi:hypothetical protein
MVYSARTAPWYAPSIPYDGDDAVSAAASSAAAYRAPPRIPTWESWHDVDTGQCFIPPASHGPADSWGEGTVAVAGEACIGGHDDCRFAVFFLIRDRFEWGELWDHFFAGRPDAFDVFVHRSHPVGDGDGMRTSHTMVQTVPTAWGDLVDAQVELCRAFTNTASKRKLRGALLASETCVPVKTAAEVWSVLSRDPDTSIFYFSNASCDKASAWGYWTKSFIESFGHVQSADFYREFRADTHRANLDESLPARLLMRTGLPARHSRVTFDCWNAGDMPWKDYEADGGHRPINFRSLPEGLLHTLRQASDVCFMRKVLYGSDNLDKLKTALSADP